MTPFILQICKKILRADPDLRGFAIFWPRTTHLSWTIFFGTKHYYFRLPTGPFHCAKFKKFLKRIQSYKDAPFLGLKWSICPKQFFFGKLLISFSSTYWPLSFCKILKKFLGLIRIYKDLPFLGPKWPICLEQFFFVQNIITFIYLLALFIVQN